MDINKQQIEYWLTEFSKLSERHYQDGDYANHEYWKGQVMGICKVVKLLDIDIDFDYYLNRLI